MNQLKFAFGFLVFLWSCNIFSSTYQALEFLDNLEFSVAGGLNWAHTKNTAFVISSYETDNAVVNQSSNTGVWKFGIGYHFLKEKLKQRNILNDLLLELNLYRSSETVKGNVFQYQLPQFHNYNFNAPVTNTRFMFDGKPGILTWHSITPYPILGIGASWNRSAYYEAITGIGIQPDSNLLMGRKTSTNFAYDLGIGARVGISKHLSASLEYLFTYLGYFTASGSPANHVRLTSAPTFSMDAQSLLISLNWNI